MKMQHMENRTFIFGLISLCLFYFSFECFFNSYYMITVDEFWFAHRIYEYKNGLPYKNFAPYKTVFGYYLLLLPMLAANGIIKTLILTKNALALLNTLVLLVSSHWLTRYFQKSAVLCGLALLISTETMLSYSTNIRVDLLSYWFCLFSLLFLLENHFVLAGILIGLGFITSQKAIWYMFASNMALGCYWLLVKCNMKMFWNIIRFNVTTLILIASYVILWTCIADWHTVINSVFYEASIMYQLDWYANARVLFWSTILTANPLVFLLSPAILLSAMATYKNDNNYYKRLFVIIYSFTILLCLIPYKQVFPYYMQVTLPIYFVLYTAFFSWLFPLLQTRLVAVLLVRGAWLWLFLFAYITGVIFVIYTFSLPPAYFMVITIPVLLVYAITDKNQLSDKLSLLFLKLMIITIVFVGGIYPLTLFTFNMANNKGDYQKETIENMLTLLQDNSDYIAGIELIYNKNQPIAGMRHLGGAQVDYLYAPTEKLRRGMLASLYYSPDVTSESVIKALKESRVKFYVNNYRMMALPRNIKQYLTSEYEQYTGSIYLYSPKVMQGNQKIGIKFPGVYLIESGTPQKITLDGKTYHSNSYAILDRKQYSSVASYHYRLKFIPDNPVIQHKPEFYDDHWQKVIF